MHGVFFDGRQVRPHPGQAVPCVSARVVAPGQVRRVSARVGASGQVRCVSARRRDLTGASRSSFAEPKAPSNNNNTYLILCQPLLRPLSIYTYPHKPTFIYNTQQQQQLQHTRVQGGCSKLQAKSPVTEGLFVHLGELISRAGPACAPVRSARGGPRPRLFCGSRP